ncbi:uncharacterized protein YrkH [Arthrobacter sp. Hiyo8]|nr:uncharacterized protein YrkH [Arthrobacter sp. Hiyo8]
MLIERIYDEDLAQASYLIGCQAKGEAIVVDGRRDIAVYQDLAARNGMKIVAVTETHIHADYLSGTRELAAATGAKIYVSGEGGPDWQYEFDGERLYDGDVIALGNISVQAVHTPGHTPSICPSWSRTARSATSPATCSRVTSSSPATWAARICLMRPPAASTPVSSGPSSSSPACGTSS